MQEDREFIEIAAFENEGEAHVLQMALNAHGIPAKVLTNSWSIGLAAASCVAGARVFVRRIEVSAALLLMKDLEGGRVNSTPSWTCSCSEEVDEGFAVCWSCGKELVLPDPPVDSMPPDSKPESDESGS